MEVFLILLACIAILIIDYWVAKQFYEIAQYKGFSDQKYLWISFFLGIAGYLLVVALPDRGKTSESSIIQETQPEFKMSKIANSDEVICCDKCGTDNPKGATICKKCKSKLVW